MAAIKVPERYIEGLIKVAELSDEEFRQFLGALNRAPELRDVAELSAWISDEIPTLPSLTRNEILTAIISMFRVARQFEVAEREFAADAYASIQSEMPERLLSIEEEKFQSRIVSLLKCNALELTSTKVMELKSELEKGFCKVRVLTDLRPVFKRDVEDQPSAMIILHTLQIGFHDGLGDHKEFYVTLDEQDVEELKRTLDRATQKAETLKRYASNTGITLY